MARVFSLAGVRSWVEVVPSGLGAFVRLVRLGRVSIVSKIVPLSLNANLRNPFPEHRPTDALIPRLVARRERLVLDLLVSCGLSQVLPRVVTSVPVRVVNFMLRPFASHIKVGEPMEVVHSVLNPDQHVPALIGAPGYGSDRKFAKPVTSLGVSEYSRFRVICKALFKFVLRDEGLHGSTSKLIHPRVALAQ